MREQRLKGKKSGVNLMRKNLCKKIFCYLCVQRMKKFQWVKNRKTCG